MRQQFPGRYCKTRLVREGREQEDGEASPKSQEYVTK
jgi:hypothetical protein